jgi:hypothetical protein
MCAICGIKTLKNYQEYQQHYRTVHAVRTFSHRINIPKKTVKPTNVSGRTRQQIVDNAEKTWLRAYLI